jgi:hypothetical protein
VRDSQPTLRSQTGHESDPGSRDARYTMVARA